VIYNDEEVRMSEDYNGAQLGSERTGLSVSDGQCRYALPPFRKRISSIMALCNSACFSNTDKREKGVAILWPPVTCLHIP
jgi:hypothetical protein